MSFAAAGIPTFAAATFRGGSFFRVAIQTARSCCRCSSNRARQERVLVRLLMLAYAAGNLG